MRVTALLAPVLVTGLTVFTVLAGLTACSGGQPRGGDAAPEEGVDRAVRLDEHRTLGAPLTIGNLRVWPVHSDASLDVGEFLTLAEAQEAGVAKVREVGSQNLNSNGSATVGTLEVVNGSDKPILILAGTVVKGGNQDRQLGQDVVVSAGATVPVQAFCVEQGRWSSAREGVATDGEFVALEAVTNASIRKNAQYAKDQGAVWEEVAAVRDAAFTAPFTYSQTGSTRVRTREAGGGGGHGQDIDSNDVIIASVATFRDEPVRDAYQTFTYATEGSTFIDVLEKSPPEVVAKRDETAAAVLAHFEVLAAGEDAPIGFAYAIGDDPVTVRAFAHHRLLAKNLGSFAKAMAVEASLAEGESSNCTAEDVVAMVKDIAKGDERRVETAAANALGLRENETGWNGKCLFDADGDGKEDSLTEDWTRR